MNDKPTAGLLPFYLKLYDEATPDVRPAVEAFRDQIVKGLEEDKGTGFKEGADLYIEKPFTEKKIVTIVENVLGLE